MPPRLIVLIVSPIHLIASNAITMESGMEIREMIVVLQFIRNMNNTMTTKMPPSISDFFTLSMELRMNFDWRKISELTFTSAGIFTCSSLRADSSFVSSCKVLTLGCLVTVRTIAGFPSLEATPRRGVLGPIFMSAIASRVIGFPLPVVFTTAFFISSMSLVERTPLTIYSLPYS